MDQYEKIKSQLSQIEWLGPVPDIQLYRCLEPAAQTVLEQIQAAEHEFSIIDCSWPPQAKEFKARAWSVSLIVGELLHFLIRWRQPDLILELGTSLGYSGIYMAAALKANKKGHLITVDFSQVKHALAMTNFKQAQVADYVRTEVNLIQNYLQSCSDKFALVFMDADKKSCLKYFQSLIKNQNFHSDSLFIVDNAIDMKGRLQSFLDFLQEQKQYQWTLLPLGDGEIIVKIA